MYFKFEDEEKSYKGKFKLVTGHYDDLILLKLAGVKLTGHY